MPTGFPGTLTHGASAYRRGACSCDVCREGHRVDAARKRAEGKMGMNSGHEIVVTQGKTAHLTRRQADVLRAWLRDGADNETVGRRCGITAGRVSHVLALIKNAYGLESRVEMAMALLRKQIDFVVVPSGQRRDVA